LNPYAARADADGQLAMPGPVVTSAPST
jgi:hypothetical protein